MRTTIIDIMELALDNDYMTVEIFDINKGEFVVCNSWYELKDEYDMCEVASWNMYYDEDIRETVICFNVEF